MDGHATLLLGNTPSTTDAPPNSDAADFSATSTRLLWRAQAGQYVQALAEPLSRRLLDVATSCAL